MPVDNSDARPPRTFSRRGGLFLAVAFSLFAFAPRSSLAAESATKLFAVPAGDAAFTLQTFSEQAGTQVVYRSQQVRGVTTHSVNGRMTARDALELMLAGTDLSVGRGQSDETLVVTKNSGTQEYREDRQEPRVTGAGANDHGSAGDTVKLNPFEVTASPTDSYNVMNSNSVTAFNVSLSHTPVTADIMDEALMQDVGATSVEDMLAQFDAGSSFGYANPAGNANYNQEFDHSFNPGVRVRGRPTTPQLDGLQLNNGNYGDTGFGSTNTFNIDRIEVINGPEALLYDGVGPGGVVNLVEKPAIFGQPTFGRVSYKIDQYGTKYATADFGMGMKNVAIRAALIDASTQTRRINISDRLKGVYVQLAAKLSNTTASLSLRQTVDTRTHQYAPRLISTSDPNFSQYNKMDLHYLLATDQAGGILNGNLNWGNVDSLAGYAYSDFNVGESAVLKVDSQWTKWLSTSVQAGLANFDDLDSGYNTSLNFYSPDAKGNPISQHWTMDFASNAAHAPFDAAWRPHIGKAIRAVALITNDLFGGRAHSRTMLDIDSASETASLPIYRYYKADGSWNILHDNPATQKTDAGRTALDHLAWTVDNGPVLYNFFNPDQTHIAFNGGNYVLGIKNSTPFNREYYYQKGVALINYTSWMNGRLDTMIGARNNIQNGVENGISAGSTDKPDYMVGAVYHVTPSIAPYINVSDLWLTNNAKQPNGTYSPNNHDVGEEFGVKLTPASGVVSGSLSLYHTADSNENFRGIPGIAGQVSPNGLNGQIPNGTSNQVNANATTWGATAALTAEPRKGWRMRLSATWMHGVFNNKVSYDQLYNDQFYENGSGQVTYADGTVVYVPAAFDTSKSPHYTVPAGTPGATPLTVQKLSTPTDSYFADPQPINGAILKTSNGGMVLLHGADSGTGVTGHGPILTGATGLPIGDYQLLPAISGVSPAGVIYAVPQGAQTFGTPRYALSFTNIYEVQSGPLKGLEVGGTVHGTWSFLNYYYMNGGSAAASKSTLIPFYYPSQVTFDPIIGYTVKFRHFTFHTQLNIYNVFNHYRVILYPNVSSGFTDDTSLAASLTAQPRLWAWTNTIKF